MNYMDHFNDRFMVLFVAFWSLMAPVIIYFHYIEKNAQEILQKEFYRRKGHTDLEQHEVE